MRHPPSKGDRKPAAARSPSRWCEEYAGDIFAPSGYRLNPRHIILLDELQRGELPKNSGIKAGYTVDSAKVVLVLLRREFRAVTTIQLVAIWAEWKAMRAARSAAKDGR